LAEILETLSGQQNPRARRRGKKHSNPEEEKYPLRQRRAEELARMRFYRIGERLGAGRDQPIQMRRKRDQACGCRKPRSGRAEIGASLRMADRGQSKA